MGSWFLNAGFLGMGTAALVSAPVIIHLINRYRFRRVEFAAMEFLLASQKRSRRRILVEQLLLLLLRILLVMALIALIGIVSIFTTPIQLFPNIERPQLSMQANWRAASPKEMESEITIPIEEQLRGIPGLETINS